MMASRCTRPSSGTNPIRCPTLSSHRVRQRCRARKTRGAEPTRSPHPAHRREGPHGLAASNRLRPAQSRGRRGRQIQGDYRPEAARPPLAGPARWSRHGRRGAQPHDPGCEAGFHSRRLIPRIGWANTVCSPASVHQRYRESVENFADAIRAAAKPHGPTTWRHLP